MDATITSALSRAGFRVLELSRSHRYHTGVVEREGAKGFFKLPIETETSARLNNEAALYQELGGYKESQGVFIPRLLDRGIIGERPWLVREYFEQALADPEAPSRATVNPLEAAKIIDFLFFLREAKVKLPNDRTITAIPGEAFSFYRAKDGPSFRQIIGSITRRYATEIHFEDIESVIKIIGNADFTQSSLNHEDYKLWHFYRDGSRLALIDGEYANNLTPLHRDFSILFTSTYTTCRNPDLAYQFLRLYAQSSSVSSNFMSDFLAMSAWITLAELRDAVVNKIDTSYHRQLLAEIISGEVTRHVR